MELREKVADIQHGIWANWMEHLFKVSHYNRDGSVLIPADKVEKWERQMETKYDHLSESDKNKDRKIADRVLEVL